MAKKPIIRYFDRGVWYDATVSDIGNLEDLNTVHKTTVVEAINDIIGGNINISGELLEKLTALDNNISRIDGLIASGSLNETQANQMNQFVTNKLNELNQSMEEMNKQRDQRLKEQEEKVAQLKLDSESDKQRIEEITLDLNATKEKLNNAELNVTSVTQLVDEINGKISQAVSKTDFDLLEGTVREQKTLIDQTVEGIKLLATKEELDKSNENVKSIKSALEVQAGLIESKVSSEQLINEIEKIDKYMPNLLRYTRNWQDWENDDEANIDVTLNEYRDCIIQRARGIGKGLSTTVEDLVIGETYSLSVWVKHDDINAKLYAMVDNVEIIMTDLNSEETFVSNEFKRMRCSFVAQGTTAKVRFIFKDCRTDSYGYLAGAKCEKNKKVSGWQPHSEDVYQSIKSARSEIKQTDGKITTLVETVNKQGDLITSHTTSIEETDKAIKLQAESIKTLDESIESAKAELKVNSDAISSKVWKTDVGEMISDINIDNKNRVLNSDFGDGWELWSETNNLFQLKQIGNYKFAVAERSGLPQNMAIAIATNKFPVKHNERLMFGFYFYCADLSKLDNKIVCALELLDINDIRIDRVDFDVSKLSLENGSFTKLTNTYFVEDERIVKARLRFFLNRNGNVGFALPMAQGGDIKSSDWSLAPEDVARRFNDTNVTISNYEQTVDGFRQTVESYKGSVDGYTNQVSEFNQTVNGFSQTIKDYKESNDKRVQQLETSLTTESGKIEAVVKESAGTKDELGKLTANGGRISQLELTASGLKTTVASQSSSIQTIQTDTVNAKQLANTAVSTANTAKSNADKAIADVASLTQTVNSQSTRIDQTSGRIDLVASGITEVGNRLDNLRVGGTNLITNTNTDKMNITWSMQTGSFIRSYYENNGVMVAKLKRDNVAQSGWSVINIEGIMLNKLKPNTQYRVSMEIASTSGKKNLNFSLRNGDGTGAITNLATALLVPNEFTKVSFILTTTNPMEIKDQNLYITEMDSSVGVEYHFKNIKMEEGNMPTPWSPAPEDQQAQIDNIQVGGRNLLTKDILSKFRGNALTNNSDGSITTHYYYQNDSALTNLKAGDTLTFSCKLKKEGDFAGKVRIGIYHDGAWDSYYMGSLLTRDYKMFSKTITMKKDGAIGLVIQNDNGSSTDSEKITFKELKLEIGNKVTDYSPAPEDTQDQIDGINNNLTNNYYQKTTVDSKLSTAVSGITAQYTQDITTKLGNYYDKSTIDSKLTIDGQGIGTYVKNTKSQLDGLQICGENLIKNTNTDKMSITWTMQTGSFMRSYYKDNGVIVSKLKRDNVQQTGWSVICVGGIVLDKLKPNTKYIISFEIQPTASISLQFSLRRGNGADVASNQYSMNYSVPANQWSKITFMLTTTNPLPNLLDQVIYITGMNSAPGVEYHFKNFKMAEGNKETPWSPAPEDFPTITQYTEVKQLADRISSTVYDSSTGLTTKVNQLAGKYAIQNLNSYGDVLSSLNLNGGNVRIKGGLIDLDGNVRIQDGFVNNLKANSILANEITAKATNIINARIVNLDASYIKSGTLNANYIRSGVIKSNSGNMFISLDNNYIGFYDKDGKTPAAKLDSNGYYIWENGISTASIMSVKKVDKPEVKGMTLLASSQGKGYISITYTDEKTGNYNPIAEFDLYGRSRGERGTYFLSTTFLGKIRPIDKVAPESMEIFSVTKNDNNYSYPTIGNASRRTGILFGGNWLYFMHDGYIYDFEAIKKKVWG